MSEADLSVVQSAMWAKIDALNAFHYGATNEGHTESAKLFADSIVRLLGELRALEAVRFRF